MARVPPPFASPRLDLASAARARGAAVGGHPHPVAREARSAVNRRRGEPAASVTAGRSLNTERADTLAHHGHAIHRPGTEDQIHIGCRRKAIAALATTRTLFEPAPAHQSSP